MKCLKKALNVQFRVRDFDDEDRGEKISLIEMCPDWNETFTYLSHNENVGLYELQEVVRVLNIYISDEYNPRNSRGARQTPLHLAVEKGYIYFFAEFLLFLLRNIMLCQRLGRHPIQGYQILNILDRGQNRQNGYYSLHILFSHIFFQHSNSF